MKTGLPSTRGDLSTMRRGGGAARCGRSGFAWALCIELCIALGLAGCQTQSSLRADVFEVFGGSPGLQAIAVELVERSAEDARIGHFFTEVDLQHVAERLAEQFCAELDGPCIYSGLPMPEAHFALGIDEADFNRLVEILLDVLERRRLPEWAQNQLIQRLAAMRGEIIHR